MKKNENYNLLINRLSKSGLTKEKIKSLNFSFDEYLAQELEKKDDTIYSLFGSINEKLNNNEIIGIIESGNESK